MAIVQSFGAVQAVSTPTAPSWVSASVALYGGISSDYGELYRTQPNVRTVVDFLARNIAQLGIHLYRRLPDDDRVRLRNHPLERTIRRPNPYSTRYRLIQDTVCDLGVYFSAFWLKVRMPDRLGLVRLPAAQMRIEGGLFPSAYVWTPTSGDEHPFSPTEVINFSGYDPDDPLRATSPLETLRHVLAEEAAAGDYREHFWGNAARMEGIIKRPKDAPPWDSPTRERFRDEWQAGAAGIDNSGLTAILEDGMEWTPNSFSMRQSEYLGARKLTREECAAAYHIPLPMVGILEHATFSNIKEQHKQLYQDSLGPTITMLEEELERQLLVDPFFGAPDEDVYAEFNIAEKLKGSFEEQSESITHLVGAPVMTRNEARARLNLRRDPNPASDELIQPLNVETPSTRAGAPAPPPGSPAPAAGWIGAVRAFWTRQGARLAKEPAAVRVAHFDRRRWNRELASALLPYVLEAGADPYDADSRARTLAAETAARTLAGEINDETLARLEAGLEPFGRDRALPAPCLTPAGEAAAALAPAHGRPAGLAPATRTITINPAPVTVHPAPITVDVHVGASTAPLRRRFTRDPVTQLITEEIQTPIGDGAA